MADSPRWCDNCKAYGDHHSDRHQPKADARERLVQRVAEAIHAASDHGQEGAPLDEWLCNCREKAAPAVDVLLAPEVRSELIEAMGGEQATVAYGCMNPDCLQHTAIPLYRFDVKEQDRD